MGRFTQGVIIRGYEKVRIFFRVPCRFYLFNFFHPSNMKRAVQSDLSLNHVSRAAAVAQKGDSGGTVSKTNVNKRRRVSW